MKPRVAVPALSLALVLISGVALIGLAGTGAPAAPDALRLLSAGAAGLFLGRAGGGQVTGLPSVVDGPPALDLPAPNGTNGGLGPDIAVARHEAAIGGAVMDPRRKIDLMEPGLPLPFLPVTGPTVDVPILYYHRVQAPPADFNRWTAQHRSTFLAYDALPEAFAAQLEWLDAHGFTTILPRDLVAHWDHGSPLPVRPVIITFDDGSRDWVRTVLPMLQSHGMVAEFYLTLDAIQPRGPLSWDEVRVLVRAGMGLGAHDVHHVQLTAIGHGQPPASLATMRYEVGEAKRVIEAQTGAHVDSMAYVGGGYDANLIAAAREAGYTTARTIQRGIVQTPDRRFQLRVVRVGVYDDVMDVIPATILPDLPLFRLKLIGASQR